MITFDDPSKPASSIPLDAPGGFVWWYLELLDDNLDGLVMIWSFGLPFLPGYTSAARAGRGEAARERPSLNIAVYRGGRPAYYVLREFDPSDAQWDGAYRWRFGDTHIEGALSPDGATRSTRVYLDCPVDDAGARISGTVTVEGPVPQDMLAHSLGFDATHAWTPLAAPANGRAVLSLGSGLPFYVSGHAYHDRNVSSHGLHDLGIHYWAWGHTRTAEGSDRIFYILWPQGSPKSPHAFGLEISALGRCSTVALRAELRGGSRTVYGMRRWDEVALFKDADAGLPWMSMRLSPRQRVDDGPFYLRYLTKVAVDGATRGTSGSLELIAPDRIDLDRHRLLVQMRVARPRGNSMWLPLFQGSRKTRLSRLARQLTTTRGARA